jgi:cytochrome c-type biogenesis protein CcmF
MKGGRSYYGMVVAHFGVAVFIIGVTFVLQFNVQKDIRLSPGQSTELAGYTLRFDGVQSRQGPNYRAHRGTLHLYRGKREISELHPEKRIYTVQTKPMTESAIDVGFTRDIYVSLGEGLGNGDWSMRLYYKPFVRWIWFGGLLIAIGGLLAASDRRYRIASARERALASAALGGNGLIANGGS